MFYKFVCVHSTENGEQTSSPVVKIRNRDPWGSDDTTIT